MRTRELYVVELAQTVNGMFGGGRTDPSAQEIAEAHFPEKALGGEIIEGIRKRLRRVRNLLEEDYEHPVYLVNRRYYTRYRGSPPTTEAEARGCIPGGNQVQAIGIRLHTDGDDDLIWQAMISHNMGAGAGKLKKALDRTLDAVEDERLSKPRAARIINTARQKTEPEKPALAKRVMKALPKENKRQA